MAYLLSCGDKASPNEPRPTTGTIYGWVQNMYTAVNVLGAHVTAGGVSGVSHGDFSAFHLENVPAGDHLLSVTATGFDLYTDTITVIGGESRSIGQIWLKPSTMPGTGIIFGWFWIEGTSEGISGVTVRCGACSDTTVWDGSYYLINIQPGTHTFTATNVGFYPHSASLTVKADSTLWHFFKLVPINQL